MAKKFKITILRLEKEEYEYTLEGDSIMDAFDDARRLAAIRNKDSKIGKYHVTKITEEKE